MENSEDISRCLKVIVVVAEGLIAGSGYYISMVEVPARMQLDMKTAIRSWKPVFNQAKKSMVS